MSVPRSIQRMAMVPSGSGMLMMTYIMNGIISGMLLVSVYAIDLRRLSKIRRPAPHIASSSFNRLHVHSNVAWSLVQWHLLHSVQWGPPHHPHSQSRYIGLTLTEHKCMREISKYLSMKYWLSAVNVHSDYGCMFPFLNIIANWYVNYH